MILINAEYGFCASIFIIRFGMFLEWVLLFVGCHDVLELPVVQKARILVENIFVED